MKEEGFSIDTSENSPNVIALKTIIKSFKENNIKFVLYMMPQNKPYYLDNISDSDKKKYNSLMRNISEEFNLSLYNYLKMTDQLQQIVDIKSQKSSDLDDIVFYDFDAAMDYYDNRDEYEFVGFIEMLPVSNLHLWFFSSFSILT